MVEINNSVVGQESDMRYLIPFLLAFSISATSFADCLEDYNYHVKKLSNSLKHDALPGALAGALAPSLAVGGFAYVGHPGPLPDDYGKSVGKAMGYTALGALAIAGGVVAWYAVKLKKMKNARDLIRAAVNGNYSNKYFQKLRNKRKLRKFTDDEIADVIKSGNEDKSFCGYKRGSFKYSTRRKIKNYVYDRLN